MDSRDIYRQADADNAETKRRLRAKIGTTTCICGSKDLQVASSSNAVKGFDLMCNACGEHTDPLH